jgi:hypothetical protein
MCEWSVTTKELKPRFSTAAQRAWTDAFDGGKCRDSKLHSWPNLPLRNTQEFSARRLIAVGPTT